ncbi:MAG: GNAT family N-acetyltransferase [Planctomycetes bacterium]|nr:GNAT family N-acetyltransferase [Planctomycetota bacterium]
MRVTVRAPSARDQEEFLARVRASRRLHHPWVSPPDTPAKFRRYMRRTRRDDFRSFLVFRREDDALVGVFNLSQIFLGVLRSAYLGYEAFAPFAGQGYMTEGMRLVLRRAFTRLGLHRVEANIQPGNLASKRLVRRLGFRKEGYSPRYVRIGGRWRDHERWAILKEEFLRTVPALRHSRTKTSIEPGANPA